MMSFCFLWGFSGWASNQLLKDVLRFPAIFFLPSLGIALVTSVIGTRWLARGISRIMPSTETYATSAQDLVGLTGEALFPINSTFGRARLYDRFRNLQDVSCRITPGEETIPSGSRIVLLRYDTVEKAYIVRPDPLGADRLL